MVKACWIFRRIDQVQHRRTLNGSYPFTPAAIKLAVRAKSLSDAGSLREPFGLLPIPGRR